MDHKKIQKHTYTYTYTYTCSTANFTFRQFTASDVLILCPKSKPISTNLTNLGTIAFLSLVVAKQSGKAEKIIPRFGAFRILY